MAFRLYFGHICVYSTCYHFIFDFSVGFTLSSP